MVAALEHADGTASCVQLANGEYQMLKVGFGAFALGGQQGIMELLALVLVCYASLCIRMCHVAINHSIAFCCLEAHWAGWVATAV